MAAQEYSQTVPVDLVKKIKGLSLDIGGSVVKIVYRSKDNLDEAESDMTTGGKGHLQLVSFPKNQLTEALEYVKHRAQITRTGTEDQPEIFSTGVGCTQFGRTISEILNIRLNNLAEFDCFAKAFIHLASQLSRNDFLEPCDLQAAKEVELEMMEQMKLFMKVQEHSLTEAFVGAHIDLQTLDSQLPSKQENCQSDDPLATCEDIYPCIIALCGSAIAYMQINADKSFKIVDACPRGGSALHGVGALLTGYQNFEELLQLASRGDPRKVDHCANDLYMPGMSDRIADSDESVYAIAAEAKSQALLFCFGKAAGTKKEEFLPEDLAIAWVNYFVLDLVQTLTLIAQVHGIRRLFFSGSLCNSPLVRRLLTKEMTRRSIMTNVFVPRKDSGTQFDFLKPGAHLGALGALITELQKLPGDNGSKASQG